MSVSTIGLFPNMQKDKVRDCLPDILALLQKHGLKTLLPEDMKDFKAAGGQHGARDGPDPVRHHREKGEAPALRVRRRTGGAGFYDAEDLNYADTWF